MIRSVGLVALELLLLLLWWLLGLLWLLLLLQIRLLLAHCHLPPGLPLWAVDKLVGLVGLGVL